MDRSQDTRRIQDRWLGREANHNNGTGHKTGGHWLASCWRVAVSGAYEWGAAAEACGKRAKSPNRYGYLACIPGGNDKNLKKILSPRNSVRAGGFYRGGNRRRRVGFSTFAQFDAASPVGRATASAMLGSTPPILSVTERHGAFRPLLIFARPTLDEDAIRGAACLAS